MSYTDSLFEIVDMLRDQPWEAPVVLTPAEYESLKVRCSMMAGEEMATLDRIAGHPVKIAAWAPPVKAELTDVDEW